MIKVENLIVYRNLEFEQYLELPGWSYSGIRNEGKNWKPPTSKMSLGTDVHNYRLEPAKYQHANINIVKPVVQSIDIALGSLSKFLEPEISVTADFIHANRRMKYKGRIDLSIIGRVVVDLKVSQLKDPFKAIQYFGYDKQFNGYATAIGARTILMVSSHPKRLQDTKIINIPVDTLWWEDQILQRGEII